MDREKIASIFELSNAVTTAVEKEETATAIAAFEMSNAVIAAAEKEETEATIAAFGISEKVTKVAEKEEKEATIAAFGISEEVAEVVKDEKKEIPSLFLSDLMMLGGTKGASPSWFNLLDVVGKIEEPKHNKILGAILKYNHNLFLESFFKEVLRLDLTLEKPFFVEAEKRIAKGKQIDVLVKNNRFALIIENKINYAHDQNSQIKGYVETVERDTKYTRDKNIYVAYLTRWGGKGVEDKSLPKELRETLGRRFLPINYDSHILPWLRKKLLQVPIRYEHINIISGLQQYINFLDPGQERKLLQEPIKEENLISRFKKYTNYLKKQKEMSDKIKEILEEKLGLKDKTYSEQVVAIQKKINEFQLCADNLRNYYQNDFQRKLKAKFFRSYCDKLYHPAGIYDEDRDFCVCLVKTINYNKKPYIIITDFYFHPDSDNPYRLDLKISRKDWGLCDDFNIKSDVVQDMIPEDYNLHRKGFYCKEFEKSESKYDDKSMLKEIEKLSKKIDDFIENHPEITRC